jgi:hypothetical protein
MAQEGAMIVIREIFFCKPGKVRGVVDKFKTMNQLSAKLGLGPAARLMTDLSAERYWTVISEWEVTSLAEFEALMGGSMANKEMQAAMEGYHELVESGRREVYKLEA